MSKTKVNPLSVLHYAVQNVCSYFIKSGGYCVETVKHDKKNKKLQFIIDDGKGYTTFEIKEKDIKIVKTDESQLPI